MIAGLVAVSILVIGLTLVANIIVARDDRGLDTIFNVLLLLINLPLLLMGLVLLLLPSDLLATASLPELLQVDLASAGYVLIGMAIWAIMVTVPHIRRFLARFLPIQPRSAVHTLALVFAGYLVGNTALSLSQNLLQDLSEISVSVSITDIVVQGVVFVCLGYAAVGFLIRRDWRETNLRLGFKRLTARHVGLIFLWIFILVVFQALVGGFWAWLDPEASQDLTSLNDILLGSLDSVGEWFLLALSAGVGEEILFRGALQPAFGLGFTSLLFAVTHVQYGLTPVTVAVFVIGLVLGLIRRKEGTTVVILIHFGYNFALGLLSLLAVYLEQFVT